MNSLRNIVISNLCALLSAAILVALCVYLKSLILLIPLMLLLPGLVNFRRITAAVKAQQEIIAVLERNNPGVELSPQNMLKDMYAKQERRREEALRDKEILHSNISGKALALTDTVHKSAMLIGMVKQIGDEISRLTENVVESSSASIHIAQTAEGFSRSIETQSSAITETSASLEESTASIQNIKKTTTQSMERSEVLHSLTTTSEELIKDTNKTIAGIVEKVSSIEAAIKIINTISSQTNLLAMNAAIEAAHAGAAGRGFAVVAGEIRKLAETSSHNSKMISQSLKGIVRDIDEVQNSGKRSYENFSMVSTEVGSLVQSLSEIDDATEEILNGSREILNAVTDLTTVSSDIEAGSKALSDSIDDITNAITDIQQISQRTGRNLDDSNAAIGDLNEYIQGLIEADAVSVEKTEKILEEFALSRKGGYSVSVMILKHLHWILKARLVMDGRLEVDSREISDHTSCELGQALAAAASTGWDTLPFFGELKAAHKKIHEIIAGIIEDSRKKERDVLEEEFRDLIRISRDIIDLLGKIDSVSEK